MGDKYDTYPLLPQVPHQLKELCHLLLIQG
jgi:hypothetical protein